jgi:hypothetical protein
MSQVSPRAVPKWPVVNFIANRFDFDMTSLLVGLGAGAAVTYLILKFVLKKKI